MAIVGISGDVGTAVRQAVALAGGLGSVIGPGDSVVIKPNLVMDAHSASGMVSSPAVVRAVVQLAWEAGAGSVAIAEGTAQYSQGDCNRDRLCTSEAFRTAGYDANGDMIEDVTGVLLLDLNDSGGTDVADPAKVTNVSVPTGLIRKEYWLPEAVLDADVLISVPVLKNHSVAGVTLGMKNLIGLLPNDLYHGPGNIYGKHSLSHSPIDLDQHIVDVNLARRPDFVVVDGQKGMTDGPIGYTIIDPPMQLILASRDVVAADTVGTLVMGYDPALIPYLSLAAQSGLGTNNTSYIRVVGTPLSQVRRDFPAPYADTPALRADAEAPTVHLSAPAEEEWAGSVRVLADTTDNEAVARVEFFLDDQQVGQALAVPYEITLDTTSFAAGKHSLRAVAYDRSLNQSDHVRQVVFVAPTAPASTVAPPDTTSPSAVPPPPTWTLAPPAGVTVTPATQTVPAPPTLVPPETSTSGIPAPVSVVETPTATETTRPPMTTLPIATTDGADQLAQAGGGTPIAAQSVAQAVALGTPLAATRPDGAGVRGPTVNPLLLVLIILVLVAVGLVVLWVSSQQRGRLRDRY